MTHHGAVLGSLSPQRRRLLITLLGVVAAAVVAVSVAVAVRATSTTDRAAAVPQDRPGPVLLVPGYGGSTTGLTTLATTLRRHGHPDVQVLGLPGAGTGDLRAQARVLDQAVTAALSRSHAASVDVVGYSAGGVVARLWARDDGGAQRARRIVTLGSPHHGTDLAALAGSVLPGACPLACTQLATDSDLLRSLNAGDETPPGPRWVSVWTTVDQTVTPPDSARLAGATDIALQDICADSRVPHGGLPTDALVGGLVSAELGPGDPTDFTPSDCTRLRAAG